MRQCRCLEISSDPRLKKRHRCYRLLRVHQSHLQCPTAAGKHLFPHICRTLTVFRSSSESNIFWLKPFLCENWEILPQVHNYAKLLFNQMILTVWRKKQTLTLAAALWTPTLWSQTDGWLIHIAEKFPPILTVASFNDAFVNCCKQLFCVVQIVFYTLKGWR